jgi:hypothetical protein
MFDRVKKFSAVIGLTLLIWAWAFLAIEKEQSTVATLGIAPTRPDLFVSFEDHETPVSLSLDIKGPPSKISELRNRMRKGEPLEFLYSVESEHHSEPGSYLLDVASFLNESDEVKGLGVSVEGSLPVRINVRVEQLVKKWLTVECVDEYGVPVATEPIEPASIQMFVHDSWTVDSLKATVVLNAATRERARKAAITAEPFIELEPDKRTPSKTSVRIKLPSTESPLKDYPINPVWVGFVFSESLQGEYKAELVNETDFRTINIKASKSASEAYQNMAYQILVEIRDKDMNETGNFRRAVIYNFPPEFVLKDEIMLTGSPKEAEIKLVKIAPKPN